MSGLPPPPRRAAGPQNSAPNSPVLEPPSSPYKHDSTTFGFRNFVDPAKYPFSDPSNFGTDVLTLVKDVKETLDGAAVNFDGIRTTQNLILERQDVILERQDAIVGRQDTMQAALDSVSVQAGVTAIELKYLDDNVNARFAAMDEKIDRNHAEVTQRLGQLEEDVGNLKQRMSGVEAELVTVNRRLQTVETTVLDLRGQGTRHTDLLMSILAIVQGPNAPVQPTV